MDKFLYLGLASFMIAAAQNRPDPGREIAERAQTAHFAYKTLKASGEMTLRRGAETSGQRTIVLERIEHPADDYDKARIAIEAPPALKDTQLISWSKTSDERQWLVTPRGQRVQRIADRGRQSAFVSSDFSYEDILKWQVDEYDYVVAGKGPCPAGTCTILDAKPRSRYSAYVLLKLYVDEVSRISKIEYFAERADVPAKTLVQQGYAMHGQAWQPTTSVMTDHRKGTSTEISWSRYVVDGPIDERRMSADALGR